MTIATLSLPKKTRAPRTGAIAETIAWAMVESCVGTLLLGISKDGLCALHLRDERREAADQVREAFPDADVVIDPTLTEQFVTAVKSFLAGKDAADIPLDLRGTPFQRSVWAALRTIPRGQTRSYLQIAQAIGRPTATRAVAQACGQNPVALLVPCHRVLRSDGGIGGFYWGLDAKRTLLRLEGVRV